MNSDYTDINIVLDRSGSMITIKDDTEGGLNTFVAEQLKLPGKAVFSLVQFDTQYEFVYNGVPLRDVKPITLEPRGNTALLDAIGRAIIETGKRLEALPEADRPARVLFIIATDGQENASREFKRDKIFEMVKHQTDVYGWKFSYIGANQDAIEEAQSMGMSRGSTMSYTANSIGTRAAWASNTRGTTAYRTSAPAASATMDFYSDEDRKKQEEAAKAQQKP